MAKKTFEISIEEMPGKKLLGNWTRLNQATDGDDCNMLWLAFSRRLKALEGINGQNRYGVCSDIKDDLDCRYWTAIEADQALGSPSGMVSLWLDGGPYACLTVDRGTSLAEAYEYLRDSWVCSQTVYALNPQKPSYELYGNDWEKHDQLKFFIPLQKRN